MRPIFQNFRFALRLLRKSPGFTIVAIVTLALGIGANTAIFSVVYATLLAPMPYPNPDQLVMVWSKIQGNRNGVSAGDFLDWKRQSTSFEDLNAWSGASFNLATAERPAEDAPEAATQAQELLRPHPQSPDLRARERAANRFPFGVGHHGDRQAEALVQGLDGGGQPGPAADAEHPGQLRRGEVRGLDRAAAGGHGRVQDALGQGLQGGVVHHDR